MEFQREVKEEKLDYKGRCVLLLSVSLSFPCFDAWDGKAEKNEKIKDCLCRLYNHTLTCAKDMYFRAACDRYDRCEAEKGRFYPYRVSVEISPVKNITPRECQAVTSAKKRQKKRLLCSNEGCIMYEVTCRLFYRGRVKARERCSFALRLFDGCMCRQNI